MHDISYDRFETTQKAKKHATRGYMIAAGLSVFTAIGFTMLGRTQVDLNIANSNLKQEKAAHIALRVKANTLIHQLFRSNFTKEQLQESDLAWEKIHNRHAATKDSLRKRSQFLAGMDTLQLGAQEKADLKADITSNADALQKASAEFMEAVWQRDLSHEPADLSSLQTKSARGLMIVDAQRDDKTKAIHFKFEPQH